MLTLVAIVALVYLAALVSLYLLQRALVYHPDGLRPDPSLAGVPEMAPVRVVTVDDLSLLAWWCPPAQDHAPTLLYLHGNAGNLNYRGPKVRPYMDRGWGVLLLAWRGFSANPGVPSEHGLYDDGRAALAFLKAQGIAADRTVLYGESLGCAVAVQMAVERRSAALVLEAPFTSLGDAGAAHYPIFPVRRLIRDRYDSAAKIGRVAAPVLIVHGERDRVVPVRLGRRLLDAACPPKEGLFVPGAGHSDLYDHGMAEAVVGFVGRFLDGARPKAK